MAAAVQRRYGEGAVYGSLAYDFNHPELYGGDTYAEPKTPAAKPKTETRTRVRTRSKRAIHTKQSIAPSAILGILVAAFLFVTGITAQVRLLGVSGQSVELEAKLSELEEQQAKLRIRYESAFNLAEIEEYATGSLGMQKPNANQIAYIDTSAPDKAVVIDDGSDEGFVDRVSDFLSGLGAYF